MYVIRTVFLILGLLFFVSFQAALAGPAKFAYQGQIVKDNGQALEANSVQFKIEILSPSPSLCVLYEESHTINMTASNGIFNLTVGEGVRPGTGTYQDLSTLSEALDNSIGLVTPTDCVSGPSYTAANSDGRKLRLTFNDGSGPVTLTQDHNIVSVPYAANATSVDGLTASDLLQINTGVGFNLDQTNLDFVFNDANWTELQALLDGTSTSFGVAAAPTSDVDNNNQKIINLDDPTADGDATNKGYVDGNIGGQAVNTADLDALGPGNSDEVLAWDGSQWEARALDDTTKLPLAGGTMTGNLNMGAQDITNANDIAAGNNVSVGNNLTVSGGIGVTNGMNSGAAINLNNESELRFSENTGNGTDYVALKAPAALAGNVVWTLPGADGLSGQMLQTNGSGTLSWSDPSSLGYIQDGGNATGSTIVVGTNDAQPLEFETNNTTAMTIDSSGNVGIGTDAPSTKLELNQNSTSSSNANTTPDELLRLGWNDNTTDIGEGAGVKISFYGPSANNGMADTELGSVGIAKTNSTDGDTLSRLEFISNSGRYQFKGNTSGLLRNLTSIDSFVADASGAGPRQELSLYANSVAYGGSADGAGIHLYGDADTQHGSAYSSQQTPAGSLTGGPVALLAGGDARMIVGANGKVAVGNALWDRHDNEGRAGFANYEGTFNIFDTSSIPALYIEGANDTEGDIAVPDGEAFTIGHWNATSDTLTQRLHINSTGNVGIGTTSPSEKLEVIGTVKATAFEGDGSLLTGVVATNSSAGESTGNYIINTDSDGSTGDGGVLFQSNGGTVASISENGNIGAAVGTAGAVGIGFQNDSDTGVYSPAIDTISLSAGGVEGLRVSNTPGGVNYVEIIPGAVGVSPLITADGADVNIDLTLSPKGTGNSLFSSGNVGIGTTLPGNKLDVVGGTSFRGTSSQVRIYETDNPTDVNDSWHLSMNGESLITYFEDNSAGPAYTPVITQTKAGDVGIGSTIPSSKLDVAGTVTATAFSGDGSALTGVAASSATSGTSTSGYNINTDSDNSGSDGGVNFQTNGSTVATITSTGEIQSSSGSVSSPGLSFTGDTNTGLFNPAADTLSLAAGGVEGLRVNTVASGVNYVEITPAATGDGPIIAAAGSDTDIDLNITPKGTGNTIITNGSLGVGTTAPYSQFEVVGESFATSRIFNTIYEDGVSAPGFVARKARGTIASPTAVQSGDYLAALGGRGYHSGGAFGTSSVGAFGVLAAENFTASAQGTHLVFHTTATGATSSTEKMRMTSDGNLGIGSASPDMKLSVQQSSGNLISRFHANEATNTDAYQGVRLGSTTNASNIYADLVVSTIANNDLFGISVGATGGDLALQSQNDSHVDFAITRGGNVGIGTTGPGSKLHVMSSSSGVTANVNADELIVENSGRSGITIGSPNTNDGSIRFADPEDSSAGIILYDHASNYMRFDTSSSERMRISSNGNVGIGTTMPQRDLHIADSSNGAHAMFTNNNSGGTTSDGLLVGLSSNGNDSVITNYESGGIYLSTSSDGTSAPETRAFISPSGNVGIGTTTASQKLVVGDDIGYVTAATSALTVGETDDTGVSRITMGESNDNFISFLYHNSQHATPTKRGVFMLTGKANGLSTNGTGDIMAFDTNSGNIGVGTTSPSSLGAGGAPTIFHISQGSNDYGLLSLSSASVTDGDRAGQINFGTTGTSSNQAVAAIGARLNGTDATNAGGDLTFSTCAGGGLNCYQRMRIDKDGNVGIGNSTPNQKLVVGDDIGSISANNATVIGASGTGSTQLFMGNDSDNFGNILWDGANDDLHLRTKSAGTLNLNQFVLDSSGNVGIGTATPTEKLHVSGAGTRRILIESTDANDGVLALIGNSKRWELDVDGNGNTGPADSFHILEGGGGTSRFTVAPGGNIGIGTASPDSKLHVDSATSGICVSNDGSCDALPGGGEISAVTTLNTGADYAEYFEAEENLLEGDLVGLNSATGKVRSYQEGDDLLGVVSTNPGVIGNSKLAKNKEAVLVALVGQVPFNENQVNISQGLVKTKDGQDLGYLLSNGFVYINLSTSQKSLQRAVSSLKSENKEIKSSLKNKDKEIQNLKERMDRLENLLLNSRED